MARSTLLPRSCSHHLTFFVSLFITPSFCPFPSNPQSVSALLLCLFSFSYSYSIMLFNLIFWTISLFPLHSPYVIVLIVTCPSSPRSSVVQTTKVHISAVHPTRSSPLTERHHHSHLYPLIWKPHSILVHTWWLWYSLVRRILILMSLFSCSCPCALSELSELQKWRKYILATREFTTQNIITWNPSFNKEFDRKCSWWQKEKIFTRERAVSDTEETSSLLGSSLLLLLVEHLPTPPVPL